VRTCNVKITAQADGRGTVEVDGHALKGVQEFALRAGARRVPELEIDLEIFDVSTFAEAEVLVPSDTAESLVALGWTPPPEQEVDGAAP
jgi:hypothetical protein